MKYYIGKFTEEEVRTGADKKAMKEARENNPGLRYSKTKITGRGQKKYLNIWIMDLEEYIKGKAL